MKQKDRRKLRNCKRRIERRLAPHQWPEQSEPMFAGSNIHYEVSGRVRGLSAGGIGAIHVLARKVGLIVGIDQTLHLLKRHLPYHESDHVLSIAFNVMVGNTRLEDLEQLRRDEAYLDTLGAQRIPDPTTAGDFLRRFTEQDVEGLMDALNRIRMALWLRQGVEFRKCAVIDVDGVVTPTTGEKKEGMSLSYKGIWGYHPLLVSLANTREPLFIVNRPGNVVSQDGAAYWIDKAIELCAGAFAGILLRGDTAFSLTGKLDGWSKRGVRFVFGYDAHPNLVAMAEELPEKAFSPLVRRAKYEIKTEAREQRENVKEQIVKENEYRNIRLNAEQIAEFNYRPGKCEQEYRMIVLRKNLTVEKGEQHLIDDIRYFFYITNDVKMSAAEVIFQSNERCDQENLIEQLKNGVNALRVPMHDLVSNWAYMVIASLAWTLKAWFALTLPSEASRSEILRMEFKRFLNLVIRVPCQVIKAARRICLRLLAYTSHVRLLFASIEGTARLNMSTG